MIVQLHKYGRVVKSMLLGEIVMIDYSRYKHQMRRVLCKNDYERLLKIVYVAYRVFSLIERDMESAEKSTLLRVVADMNKVFKCLAEGEMKLAEVEDVGIEYAKAIGLSR